MSDFTAKSENFRKKTLMDSLKVYCPKTESLVKKLNIEDVKTREEMNGEPDEPEEYHHIRLIWYVDHSISCQKPRCIHRFCYSFKQILPHYKTCCHVDCRACNVFNVLVWFHVRICESREKCQVPGCKSICRAIGKNQRKEEPCFSGYEK